MVSVFGSVRRLTTKNIAFKSRRLNWLWVAAASYIARFFPFLAYLKEENDGAAIFNPHQPDINASGAVHSKK